MQILTIAKKESEKFLRRPTAAFDFSKHTKKEIRELLKTMRRLMRLIEGVGLSANQVGLNASFFVAQAQNKFYAIFNPKITRASEEKSEMEEGCLSIPEKFGLVPRSEKIWLEGEDASGKKIKIKAWGFLARVFQHEIDHLNGVLFLDKAKELHKIPITPPEARSVKGGKSQ